MKNLMRMKRSDWLWTFAIYFGSDFSPGTLRKNVSLVQKSRRTSTERSFFAECPRSKFRAVKGKFLKSLLKGATKEVFLLDLLCAPLFGAAF
jgi:hypothetical protein